MNIVLLSDGTGNAAASVWRSNVWRIFASLERVAHSQVVQYGDGVGTSSFLPDYFLGLMFGKGLKQNVLHYYEFLCRTYTDGDEIFAFGFSRGSFTIYTLIGMIADQGLVTFSSEAELHRKAKAAYKSYRLGKTGQASKGWALVRQVRSALGLRDNPYDLANNRPVNAIRFVGLWDTVGAYGLPVEEMARGISRWFSELRLPDRRLSKIVKRACHALSLDDERTTFHPILWDESGESPAVPDPTGRRYVKDERISQVWFAGVHANVGGGYPDDSLAHVSLYWMMQEASLCGLKFKASPVSEPDAFKTASSMKDDGGRLYDSRKGFQRIYRYGPRKLFDLCHTQFSQRPEDKVEIDLPKIHCSVFDRIQSGTDQYSPIGLPERYEIVRTDGEIVASTFFEPLAKSRARAEYQERAWNLVWWRRIINFFIASAVVFLFLYPLFFRLPAYYEFISPLRPISDLIRLIGAFLPSASDVWISGYARSPSLILVLVFLIVFLSRLGRRLTTRTQDELRSAWAMEASEGYTYLPNNTTFRFRNSWFYKTLTRTLRLRVAPLSYAVLSAALLLYLIAIITNKIAFLQLDAAGVFCRDPSSTSRLARGQERVVAFPISEFCFDSGIIVEANARYLITIEATVPWSDGGNPVSTSGYRLSDLPISQRLRVFFLQPLKRLLGWPWFSVVARIGSTGSEEMLLNPDPTDGGNIIAAFRPARDGQLFFYVNDLVLGVPGMQKLFYDDNTGAAKVTIRRR